MSAAPDSPACCAVLGRDGRLLPRPGDEARSGWLGMTSRLIVSDSVGYLSMAGNGL